MRDSGDAMVLNGERAVAYNVQRPAYIFLRK